VPNLSLRISSHRNAERGCDQHDDVWIGSDAVSSVAISSSFKNSQRESREDDLSENVKGI